MLFFKKAWPFIIMGLIVIGIFAFTYLHLNKPVAPIKIYKATVEQVQTGESKAKPTTHQGAQDVETSESQSSVAGESPIVSDMHRTTDESLGTTDESLATEEVVSGRDERGEVDSHTRDEAEVSFEELPDADETPLDSDTKDSFAAFLESLEMSEEEYERRRIATETVMRITNNPENWVKGRPGEVGFMFVLTDKENREFLEANYILRPSEGNRKALENLRTLPAQKFPAANPEVSEILRFGNYELRIHKPIR